MLLVIPSLVYWTLRAHLVAVDVSSPCGPICPRVVEKNLIPWDATSCITVADIESHLHFPASFLVTLMALSAVGSQQGL